MLVSAQGFRDGLILPVGYPLRGSEMKTILRVSILLLLAGIFTMNETNALNWPDHMQIVLDETTPLEHDRGDRLPLYLWQAIDAGDVTEATAREMLKNLDERGVGVVSSWNPNPDRRDETLRKALIVAKVQTELGLRVNVNANACLYSFFNGDEQTAHIDKDGNPFFDESFGKNSKMGCPFTLDYRKAPMKERIDFYAKAYKEAGVNLDFVFADWEIDGPIEVNRAHEASLKCTRCRKNIKNIEDFTTFQKVMRDLRSDLQRECYAEPILSRFPKALVGNYAIYPNNGLRYWYDYFETYEEGQPYEADQRAKYRKWVNDFPGTGYTFAMPVVYTWYPTFEWYDFEDLDYRWFYNMLLVASNAGENTPADVPIISFVHWHTTAPPENAAPVKQFSEEKYQELLWHMLLRGTDTFFLWSPANESAKEIRLLHPVYAAAQEYGEFLEKGEPIFFDVPKTPAPVVSGLRLGDRVLVRRTDFGDAAKGPVEIKVGEKTLKVDSAPGECRVLALK